MRALTRRPTLPTGLQLPESAYRISKAIWASGDIEAYLLSEEGRRRPSGHVLVLLREPADSEIEQAPLLRFWSSQGLTVSQIALARLLGGTEGRVALTIDLTSALHGEMARSGAAMAPERLLNAGQQLLRHAAETGVEPVLLPDVLWVDPSSSPLIAPIALPASEESPRRVIRALGRFCYWMVSGIGGDTYSDGQLPALCEWHSNEESDWAWKFDILAGANPERPPPESIHELQQLVEEAREPPSPAPGSSGRGEASEVASAALDPPPAKHGLAAVAGMDALKQLIREEVVGPLRNPEPYREYGLTIPNGVLLFGPPGCGKTYVARRLAEELGHSFVEIVPSEVASPFIHGSVAAIRDVFDQAESNAPAVVFIDEIESLAPRRGEMSGHQTHKAEEVAELLTRLGVAAENRVLVIGATNEPEKLDPAVIRPGRFDKLIHVGPPDESARDALLRFYCAGRPLHPDLDLARVAKTLERYSAADIRLLVDEAARAAMALGAPITFFDLTFHATQRVPPSLSSEDLRRYDDFGGRGA